MFIKQYLYCFKRFIINPPLFFWSLMFPFILATMFFLGFGNLLQDVNVFEPVPVAVVMDTSSENAEYYQLFLDSMTDGDAPLLKVTKAALDEAEKLLEEQDVDGILTLSDQAALTVSGTGVNQTILKNLIDIYERKAELFGNISTDQPELLTEVADLFAGETAYLKEVSLSSSQSNGNAQYFYALIAMTCLNACFFGLTMTIELQANLSPLAIRRCCAPARKSRVILTDFLAALSVQFIILILLFIYLAGILKIDFGSQLGLTMLTAFIGCIFGISLGMFTGAVSTRSLGTKIGIVLSLNLSICFLAGLMFNLMPYIIEKSFPIVNRLNPAYLISSSFYCLTYYDNYNLYLRNMLTLISFAVILCSLSVLLLRRKKYASL